MPLTPDPNEAFDDGLDRVSVDYDSDDGNVYRAAIRKAYLTLSGFTSPTTASEALPKERTMRFIYLERHDTTTGKTFRRKVHVSAAQLAAIEHGTVDNPHIDGFDWEFMGYDGESQDANLRSVYIAP